MVYIVEDDNTIREVDSAGELVQPIRGIGYKLGG
jgi:hypothetical protein